MKLFILSVLLVFSINAFSQMHKKEKGKLEIGAELELYPVGYMPVLTSNFFIKENWALRFRIGANLANREDFSGLNDSEIAKGFGVSTGVVKYFPIWKGNVVVGFTTDFWQMKTQWKDGVLVGETKNLVIQPWVNSGYLYSFSDTFNAGVSLGFGREINTFNRGKEVGQGWMGIVTISTNYSIN